MPAKPTLPVDAPYVEDMELFISWRHRHMMAFVYEVDTSAVEPLLPPGIHPVEARPGVSMLFVSMNDYMPTGNFIDGVELPAFQEVTRCVVVQPDLSIKMPIPRFTFFVLQIGSNHQGFIQQEKDWLHLPTTYSPSLRTETNATGTEIWVRDDDGPIQHLRNTHPTPVFRNESFFGQYYTAEQGRLYFGVWSWRAIACIHQRQGDAGGIFAHPFLTGVQPKLSPDALLGPYQQVITRLGHPSEQRFYRPRMVRDLGGWGVR